MSKSAQFGFLKAPLLWQFDICGKLTHSIIPFGNNSSMKIQTKQFAYVRQMSINNSQTNFISWVIGFTVGDGSFSI